MGAMAQTLEVGNDVNKKTTPPTLHDPLWARCQLRGDDLTLFKLDVSKAHRRIKIRSQDWKHMSATIKQKFWANMGGTCGVASAQFYWSKVAARQTRVTYHFGVRG